MLGFLSVVARIWGARAAGTPWQRLPSVWWLSGTLTSVAPTSAYP